MPKYGFRLNYKEVGRLLKATREPLQEAAKQVLDQVDDKEAFLEEYETDRAVVGVMVPADKQAKHGVGTRAANTVASTVKRRARSR